MPSNLVKMASFMLCVTDHNQNVTYAEVHSHPLFMTKSSQKF